MNRIHTPSLLTCASKSAWQVEYRPSTINHNDFIGANCVGVHEGEDR